MAAVDLRDQPVDNSDNQKEKEIASLFNSLGAMGLANLAENSILREVMVDYFCESERDLDYEDDGEDDRPDDDGGTELTADQSRPQILMLNQPDDSSSDDEDYTPVRHLADEIFPTLPEKDQETENERMPLCDCKLFEGRPCYLRFDRMDLLGLRLQCLEMTREELDICILAKLSCCMNISEKTSGLKHKTKQREAQHTDYRHHGFRICRTIFKYLHGIGQDKLNALVVHYKAAGIEARVHKSSHRRPHNALQLSETRMIVEFIINYAEVHAISLPGRTPYHWKDNVKLLPSNCFKKTVYDQYQVAASADGMRVIGYSTFRRIWQETCPFITTMRPATDLCWLCQQGSARLSKAANLSDPLKRDALQSIQEHLERVTKERSVYTSICKESKDSLGPGAVLKLEQKPVCQFEGKLHYSFDFAQQVMYPSDPLQPGPIYFKAPRKCALFGVCCEALSSQVNFLIDEGVDVGKGANCVVSMLHFFFEHYGFGETEVHLHADNCSGQNKNSCMMMYLMWRVLTGRHRKITLSFMITGHTKFSCDWCFGLVKRLYRRTSVNCLADIADVVSKSSKGNIAQLCGNEKGDVFVPMYDWTTFLLGFFRKVKQIKKHHHFSFSEGSGVVKIKEYSDSEEVEQNLLVKEPQPDSMPEILAPKGLDLKRQWYLYKEIREFILDDSVKDLVAPKPVDPLPGVQPRFAAGDDDDDDDDEAPPPSKVSRKGSGVRGRGGARGRGRGRGAPSTSVTTNVGVSLSGDASNVTKGKGRGKGKKKGAGDVN